MSDRPTLSAVTSIQTHDPPSRIAAPSVPLNVPAAWVGREIDDYRILRVIGAGGMGVVFLAEQRHPKRHVAIKTLHAGLHQAELLARFQQEAEILARFTHVGIAQIYASGRTDASMGLVPYIVMEYVEGAPLLEFCAALDVRARLELLRRVCDAIEHAHIRGVIHRDLKPGNILVQSDGQPKVLDFGVARLSGEERGSELTTAGMVVGTIAYMSPEQAMGEPGAVDIRTDVYALGMIGYRMLTGDLPYEVTGHNLAHALQQICDVAPTPLSRYDRRYAGDLETIFQKALAKEKDQRYRNAAELSEDLRRYLSDEAILARRASVFADVRRFARRNRALFAAAVIVVIALVGAVAISTRFALSEQAQRREADAIVGFMRGLFSSANPVFAQGRDVTVREVMDGADETLDSELADAPAARARVRATIAESYRALGDLGRAESLFAAAAKDAGLANLSADEIAVAWLGKARSLIDRGEARDAQQVLQPLRDRSAQHSPAIQLQVDLMLAQVQDLMNDPNDALRGFESVLATLSAAADCDVCEANWRVLTEVEARISSARLLRELKRAPESLTEARRAWQFAKEQLGATHPISLTAANEVSKSLLEAGEREQALREAELAYQERLRLLGNSHWQTLSAQNNLAMVKEGLGAGEEAERMLEDALAIGGGDPSANQVVIATIEDNLGRLRFLARDTGRAEQLMKRAYERRVDGLGPNHPDTVQAASNLSVLYSQIGKYDAAKPLMEAAVRGTTARFGAEHRESLRVRSEYASLLRNSGDYLAADAEFGKVLEASLRSFSVGDTDRLRVLYQYSGSLQRQERWAEAERMSRQLMDEARVASDPTAAHALLAPLRHARSLMGLRRYAEAEPLLVALERSLGAEHQAQMREMTRQLLAELRAAKAAP